MRARLLVSMALFGSLAACKPAATPYALVGFSVRMTSAQLPLYTECYPLNRLLRYDDTVDVRDLTAELPPAVVDAVVVCLPREDVKLLLFADSVFDVTAMWRDSAQEDATGLSRRIRAFLTAAWGEPLGVYDSVTSVPYEDVVMIRSYSAWWPTREGVTATAHVGTYQVGAARVASGSVIVRDTLFWIRHGLPTTRGNR